MCLCVCGVCVTVIVSCNLKFLHTFFQLHFTMCVLIVSCNLIIVSCTLKFLHIFFQLNAFVLTVCVCVCVCVCMLCVLCVCWC